MGRIQNDIGWRTAAFGRRRRGPGIPALIIALVMTVSCIGMKRPEVADTVNITDVGSTPGTSYADLFAQTDNAGAVSACGFYWGKDAPANKVLAELGADGAFQTRISGLEPGSDFVFCAFVGNGVDEKRSELLSFTTDAGGRDDPGTPLDDPDLPDVPDGPVYIPDQHFLAALLQKFDADGDGELSDFEINSVEGIFVSDDDIVSVAGIEYFRRLLRLDIRGEDNTFGYYPSGKLASLDISRNQSLLELGISHENISSVDISRNPSLIYLQVFSCSITGINLTGADKLVLLAAAYCKLADFTVKGLKSLEEVHVDHNMMTKLRMEDLPELIYLDCSGNQLNTLDLSTCPKLETLDCHDNPKLETVFLKRGHTLKVFTRDEGVKIVYKD